MADNKEFDNIAHKSQNGKKLSLETNDIKNNNAEIVDEEDNNKKDPCTKRCANNTWVKLLYDYALETSFHGPKEFVQPQPFIVRRVIWLLIFLVGTAIFLMQTITSIQKYYSFPSSVNVKVDYNTSILFPAVTICNGNAFRATSAYQNNLYNMITDVYGNPNFTNVSMYEPTPDLDTLYSLTGHRMKDLIVSCVWNYKPCLDNNFVTTMTDFGRCFTFNTGESKAQIKAYETGTNGGLQLQLNTEQYEYMVGPNAGAGLKVMIHNPTDTPLVREHGLAVPPGSHGLIGIKTSVIKNLPPRYGICNDSVKLEYFDDYTVQNCFTNCKQKYLYQRCKCRDIYMPPKQGLPKACNLNLYNTCMKQTQEEFYKNVTGICRNDCPVPCTSILHQPTISYASISNFDIEAILKGNITNVLQTKYVKAREVTQRVNKAIVKEDVDLITNLNTVVKNLGAALEMMHVNVHNSVHKLQDLHTTLKKRKKFHSIKALGGVRYIVEHNFIRGWKMFSERAFHSVTSNFMDFPMIIKSSIVDAFDNETLPLSTVFTRNQAFVPLKAQLMGRKSLIKRAKQYIEETNAAYWSDSKPLLTYQFTYNRTYDLTYITHYILNANYWDRNNTYDTLLQHTDQLDSALNVFIEAGQEFVQTGIFNETYFDYGATNFIEAGKGFNYRLFVFDYNVVQKPLRAIDGIIAKFKALETTYESNYRNVELHISELETVHKSSLDHWQTVLNITRRLVEYLENKSLEKTPVAMEVTNQRISNSIQLLMFDLQQIRTRVVQLLDALTIIATSYTKVFDTMVSEPATNKFYEALYGDCQEFLNGSKTEHFMHIFHDLLYHTPIPVLKSMNPADIVTELNGDLYGYHGNSSFIKHTFAELKNGLNISLLIGNNDAYFSRYITAVQTSFGNYITGNQIGVHFYKQNFMTLDVFMKELSYEEITQQQAYDIPQMLSEIGGSMGLFIGGSVLSAFEFIDVFIHHAARVILHR